MKLKFDHAFTADPRHRFHKILRRLGFLLMPGEVEHPGLHFCRFIAFRESNAELPVYLEFIHAGDPKKPIRSAGLSLRAIGSLEKAARGFGKKRLKALFVHKNYEWKTDSKSRLPGWNFVTFKNTGFRGLFPWITEYEPRAGRKPLKIQRHPNGVRRLIGLEIEINPAGRLFFAKVFGRRIDRPVKLPEGQTIYFSEGKSTRLNAVVLETISLKTAKKFIRGPELQWRGRPALRIQNPKDMWDIIIVERGRAS